MNLKNLTSVLDVKEAYNLKDVEISNVEYYSKDIKPGNIFFCIKGWSYKENNFKGSDGHLFIEESLNNGAVAFVVSSEYNNARETNQEYKKSFDLLTSKGVPVIVIDDTIKGISKASAHFYSYPSRDLKVIGITGTNGKTTITYLFEHIFNNAGFTTGVVGTVTYRYAGKVINNVEYTTPKSLYLQRIMKTMLENNVSHYFMEVSSHSIEFARVDDIDFDVAVFTNLTRDHIDFHQTVENYFEAKKKLFTKMLPASSKKNKFAVINSDCQYGKILAEETKKIKSIKTLTYSFNDNKSDLQVVKYKLKDSGTDFTARIGSKNYDFFLPLVGKHNVYNVISAILTGCACYNLDPEKISKALPSIKPVPGRLEKIGSHNVYVDYAHTDDALKNAITALREVFPDKKLITIFGCGGNRDSGKRPKMGKIVSELSDFAVVTSDNPRFEEPDLIIKDILEGIDKKNFISLPDRKEAINKIISNMNTDEDVVLIAGKGHEDYQEIKGVKYPFSDAVIAREFLLKYGK